MLIIRPYGDTDKATLHQFIAEFQNHEKEFESDWLEGSKMAESYLDYLLTDSKDDGQLLVAEIGNVPVGYICFYIEPLQWRVTTKQLTVINLFVCNQFRKQGIGRALLDKSIEYAKKRNIKLLTLNVIARNEDSREMYKKCGLRDVEVVMTKEI